jgi:hypothetical protein
MTYRQENGAADHHPGPVTLGILQDMGWTIAAPETVTVHMPLVFHAQPPATGWVTIMSEGFEGAFPGESWLVVDENPGGVPSYWGRRDCRSSEGDSAAWSGGAGDSPPSYGSIPPGEVSAWMVYGPFSLVDATAAELVFDWWSDSEPEKGIFSWGASVDDFHYHGSKASGDHTTWTIGERLDFGDVPVLGSLLGQEEVWISFSFESEAASSREGAWVDNVLLRKHVGAAATAPKAAGDAVSAPSCEALPNPIIRTASWRRQVQRDRTTGGGLR